MSYLFVFAICYIVFGLAERTTQKENHIRSFWIYSSVGILILCVFAGARDYSIGVDVIHYVYPAYMDALVKDIQSYLSVYTKEQLYYIVAYLSSHIGSGMFFLLLINEAIILIPLAVAFYKLRDRISFSFSMLLYMLLFYNFFFVLYEAVLCYITFGSSICFN